MSRQIALKSLQMSMQTEEEAVTKKNSNLKISKKNKTNIKTKTRKLQQRNQVADKTFAKNVKYFRKEEKKSNDKVDTQKILDYLMNPRKHAKKKTSNETSEFSDDDTDFGKSILFDDVTGDNDDVEDGSFGDWNKQTKKKEKQMIFQRKK